MSTHSRELSFDERLAAEAAFSGRPFSPRWSQSARAVYDGILRARGVDPTEDAPLAIGAEDKSPTVKTTLHAEDAVPPTKTDLPTMDASHDPSRAAEPQVTDQDEHDVEVSREQAIEAGGLIEITPFAKSMGVPYVVGMTRPLWDTVVTASDSIPETAREGRLRDILMALRLRLMAGPITRSVIDFPALLTFPPEAVPQPQLLLAAFHEGPNTPTCITLLLPRELSALLQHSQD